ncbi:hemerythrin domain-containing protein [Paracidovorax valerianellae]|uniref:Hemerythrin-like metal-binding domain protein n=1 Tax=Paracidovorax valerianellae TaxID=187868 RepID=A0A1G7E010_9BURK|nr:hemerythrin domain-containing protein [Paracidovorax valerianellae]MDA8444558.1 hemerythrin [Paracidovorax valerianellae]SDE57014.1 hemerythrin-like metal-binding domain protein [Paracidovorax valerianellae]
MAALQWSEGLALDLPLMDETHQEFVELLGAVEAAADAQLLGAWQALVAHTADHFAREDAWMAATRFASGNCHSLQHKVVLQVLREGTAQAEASDLPVLRRMATELALWFPQHTQTMDAALALHLRRVGFDPATGTVHAPDALPAQAIHGCGGACSGDEATPAPVAVQSLEREAVAA